MNHVYYLGAAYAAVWILIYLYVRRLTVNHKKLTERVEALEKSGAGTNDA